MELATPHPEQNDVCGKLEQGIAADPHEREYSHRQQRHGHHHDLCCDRQVHPHQFWVAHKQKHKHSLYRVRVSSLPPNSFPESVELGGIV